MVLKSTSHSGSNRQLCKESDDVISNLPPNVTLCILECLPLHYAMRTSILSRHWRYKWAMLSQLIFNQEFFDAVLNKFNMGSSKAFQAFSNIISNILFRRMGPIDKFVFHIPDWLPLNADISHWLQFVSQNGVKELSLLNYQTKPQKLPSCLFSSVGLTHLTLHECQIPYLPPTFKGFPCLISMDWQTRTRSLDIAEAKVLENLISLCSQLWHLSLFLVGVINLAVCAPELQDLVVTGILPILSLKATPNIKRLVLHLVFKLDCWYKNMGEFFSRLLSFEMLVLNNRPFWPCMVIGEYDLNYEYRS